MEIILLILGIVFLLIFFIPVKTGGVWNIGNKTGLVIGLLLYIAGMFYHRIYAYLQNLWQSFAGKALLLGIGGCLLLIIGLAIVESLLMLKAVCNRPKKEGTLIVLGCKLYEDQPSKTLKGRLMAAYHYMMSHPDAICIVSGGQGDDEPVSEAESMYCFLIEKGLAPERIYKEDKSRSTKENLYFSQKIIRDRNLNPEIIIVTSGFHQYRASLIAKKMKVSFYALSGQTPWWLLPTFYLRELYGILYEFLLGIAK